MSFTQPRRAGLPPRTHFAVQAVERRRALQTAVGAVLALVLAIAGTVAVPNPSLGLTLALTAGIVGVVYLVRESRLEVTVLLLVLYLGLLDGPVKLASGGHEMATVFRDVLIFAVSLGAVLRLLARRRRVQMPPLSAWVVLWVALVLAETLNPRTQGIVKALGGYRQQLEFVPFFFFGYALMRSERRFRQLFLVLGVLALANGLVSTYQTKLSIPQLASWGPGYRELVEGSATPGLKTGVTARAYVSEGTARLRPPALGKDSGFGGSVGVIALPCALALLMLWRRRGRWLPLLFALGALLAVVTGLGRLQVVGAVLGLLVFVALAASAGRRVTRVLVSVLAVVALAVPLGAVLLSQEAPGTFSRYAELAPESAVGAKDKKGGELSALPHQLSIAPFGVGLSSAGAARGFGGVNRNEIEGHGVGGDTQYNFLGDELGILGLVLWVGLLGNVIVLALLRLRKIENLHVRISLAAMLSVLVTFLITGVSGPVTGSAGGPYFWFACGTAAFWLGGRRRPQAEPHPARAAPAPADPVALPA